MKYNEYEPTVWAIKPGLLAFFIHNMGYIPQIITETGLREFTIILPKISGSIVMNSLIHCIHRIIIEDQQKFMYQNLNTKHIDKKMTVSIY